MDRMNEQTKQVQEAVLGLDRAQRDTARLVLEGVTPREQAPPSVKALLITRALHPDLAEILDRPEEFEGPNLPEAPPDEPNPIAHAHIHHAILDNALEHEDASRAFGNLLRAALEHHQDFGHALHAAVHVMAMIQTAQILTVWQAAETSGLLGKEVDKKAVQVVLGSSPAVREAKAWLELATSGRVHELPYEHLMALQAAPEAQDNDELALWEEELADRFLAQPSARERTKNERGATMASTRGIEKWIQETTGLSPDEALELAQALAPLAEESERRYPDDPEAQWKWFVENAMGALELQKD